MDNQIVWISKIGQCQHNWTLCIHVVVNNMITIKSQNHSYLFICLLSMIVLMEMHANAKTFEKKLYAWSMKCTYLCILEDKQSIKHSCEPHQCYYSWGITLQKLSEWPEEKSKIMAHNSAYTIGITPCLGSLSKDICYWCWRPQEHSEKLYWQQSVFFLNEGYQL